MIRPSVRIFSMETDTTMTRSLLLPLLASVLSGCVVYADPPGHNTGNSPPVLTYTDAGCYWDYSYSDYVWYFEADADDLDGPGDVTQVWADVYDDYTGDWVDGFDLLPDQGITWFSAWVGSTTYLDCTWPGYVVDITAVDSYGASDVATLYPAQIP